MVLLCDLRRQGLLDGSRDQEKTAGGHLQIAGPRHARVMTKIPKAKYDAVDMKKSWKHIVFRVSLAIGAISGLCWGYIGIMKNI